MERRKGDAILIEGDYQYKAITSGNPVQRFWHHTKHLVIHNLLPPAPEDFALDVGCGSGVISSFLGETARRVIGIDGNPRAVAFARGQFASDRVSFIEGLVDNDITLDEPVDKIYCLEVIEHIYREQGHQMLKNFRRLLKPDGRVFLTTPNYRSLWPLIEWGMDHFSNLAQLDGDQHVMHYTTSTLARLAAESGYRVERNVTVSFLAPWIAPLSWSAAEKMHQMEIVSPILPGSIVACVLAPQI